MQKAAKILCSAGLAIFTLLLLFGLTVIVTEKTTGDTFFMSEAFCSFRISPFLIFWLGVLGDACAALTICIMKKAKKPLKVLSAAVIVISLFSVILSGARLTVDRRFYYESAPDGNKEIIVCNYQFLIAGGGEVYWRVNPFFIRRLVNEEKKHVEWFYDDYTVEWNDKSVIVNGYTYLLPEK